MTSAPAAAAALGASEVVVAGHAQQAVRQTLAGGGNVTVVASQMHAVGSDLEREIDIVIHDEECAARA